MKLKPKIREIFYSLIVIFQSVTVFGCTQTFPIKRLPDAFMYSEYNHGSVSRESNIYRGDQIYEALHTILQANQAGWSSDINTYAPSLYFKSEWITINCTENSMIINYKPKDRDQWIQISKSIHGCRAAIVNAQTK